MRPGRLAVALVLALVAACDKPGPASSSTPTAPSPSVSPSPTAAPSNSPAILSTSTPSPDPAPTRTPPSPAPPPVDLDAGTLACKPLRPIYVDPSFIAPVVLRIDDSKPIPVADLVFNDMGTPHIVTIPADDPKGGPPDASDPAVTPTAARTKSTLPSCASAGDILFCPDATGAIHSWRGDRTSVVAHARAGTDVAAALAGDRLEGRECGRATCTPADRLEGRECGRATCTPADRLEGRECGRATCTPAEHVALAYLAERTTTEGTVREAWAVLDDSAPVRVSEDGSGATFVELVRRGAGLLAMTIDARVAMTPAHARVLTIEAGKLLLGPDAVVFVGGSAEPHNAGALASAKDGTIFELVGVADGATAFGMAAIRVEDPPREDEPVVWSLYPNGLDPAPIAATHGGAAMIVARVRPRTAEPKSSRVLELGELSHEGVFSARCIIDEAPFIKDVELEQDRQGGLWVFYRDPRGSVLERRSLASAASLPGRR